MSTKSIAKPVLTGLGLLTAAGLVMPLTQADAGDDAFSALPGELVLTGMVRDFAEPGESNGHTDFERRPDGGFGHYTGNVALELDEAGKPVFVGGGTKIRSQAEDADGRPIAPHLAENAFDSYQYGDREASTSGTWNGGIESAESFHQWFRDVPGVNMTKSLNITLKRQPNSNVYVFDDRSDPDYSGLGGFFPINNELFGNSDGENKNFHFTFELATEFRYEKGQGHVFTFRGDDDVWVFIDGKLVIDIGGVHSAVEQTIDLDRLAWLEDGETYSLHFFFAERHRTQSNFRIETTLNLRTAELPNSSHLYD